jgi:hypothetical protein
MKPPYSVPKGWSKGEPLTFNVVSDSCYQVYRSGSYLMVPGVRYEPGEPTHLEFESRVAMNDFLQWWDAPPSDGRPVELTRSEYLEYVQELLDFAPSRFSGVLGSILPQAVALGARGELANGLCYRGTEAEAAALRAAHQQYWNRVINILYPEREEG